MSIATYKYIYLMIKNCLIAKNRLFINEIVDWLIIISKLFN